MPGPVAPLRPDGYHSAGLSLPLNQGSDEQSSPTKQPHMIPLKLIALDAEDLAVISAHLQDAVVRVGDMTFMPREKRFAAVVNRFDWAGAVVAAATGGGAKGERRRTGLRFERVLKARISGIALDKKTAALALLAITFEGMGENDPGGRIRLDFAGGGAIELVVECIEAELKDLGAAWRARRVPDHGDGEGAADSGGRDDGKKPGR